MKNADASNKIHDSEATLMTWSLYDTNSVCMSNFFFLYTCINISTHQAMLYLTVEGLK